MMFNPEVKNELPFIFLSILSLSRRKIFQVIMFFYTSRTPTSQLFEQRIRLKLSAEFKQ